MDECPVRKMLCFIGSYAVAVNPFPPSSVVVSYHTTHERPFPTSQPLPSNIPLLINPIDKTMINHYTLTQSAPSKKQKIRRVRFMVDLVTLPLTPLVHQCRQERAAFLKMGVQASPACVELFRRAFAGKEAAWAAIFQQVFQGEIQRWVEAAARVRHLSAEDVAEAIQETHLAFWRYAPQAPTLLQSGDLAPIIAYLQKCVMSAVSTVARKLPPLDEVALENLLGSDEATEGGDAEAPVRKWAQPPQRAFTEEWVNLQEIIEELKKILQDDLERLIAQECFLNGTAPREFLADYADRLSGDDERKKLANLNQALKRIRLRAEKSPTFQQLQSARRKSDGVAFLTYTVSVSSDVGEATMPDVEECALDEATLLEYVQGNAAAELRAAIERSPACMAAAHRLADEVAVLTPLLRLALCPDGATLIDYFAKALPSAQQLVVHNHVQRCRQCQGEIAIFAAIEAVPLRAEAPFFRRLIEAVLTVPTLAPSPVRGAILQYQTPTIYILLDTRKSSGKMRTWTLVGELRTHEGIRFTDLESVRLQQNNEPESPMITATIEEDNSFVVKRLEAGSYRVHIVTSTEEINIRELIIGDDG